MSTYRRQRLLGQLDVLEELIAEAGAIAGGTACIVRAWAEDKRRMVAKLAEAEKERARQTQVDRILGRKDTTDWAALVTRLVDRHGVNAVAAFVYASPESIKRWMAGEQRPRVEFRERLHDLERHE